jgi:predicted small metal-binding protein
MHVSIGCRELGIDCHFVNEGETEETVVESIMRHVQTEHTDDWFEMEELHQIAWTVVQRKAA